MDARTRALPAGKLALMARSRGCKGAGQAAEGELWCVCDQEVSRLCVIVYGREYDRNLLGGVFVTDK